MSTAKIPARARGKVQRALLLNLLTAILLLLGPRPHPCTEPVGNAGTSIRVTTTQAMGSSTATRAGVTMESNGSELGEV